MEEESGGETRREREREETDCGDDVFAGVRWVC